MRLLLVEDNLLLGEGLVDALQDAHFVVDWLQDGHSAQLALTQESTFDGVILDIGLPKVNGLELLAWMRSHREAHIAQMPVLLLTARDGIDDRVLGLNTGADDYMIKPFSLKELIARIHALLRRQFKQSTNLMKWRDYELNLHFNSLTKQGETIALTAVEFKLLTLLLMNRPHHLSRNQLEEKLYGWQNELESNALDVHLSHLRKKLGEDAIINTRNLGWRMGDDK